jgi:hypothetical protein
VPRATVQIPTASFVCVLFLWYIYCCALCLAVPRVIRDQDRHKAGGAAELLLQRNLEITEMKSSEARTIAATRADVFKDGAGGISSKAEGSHVPAVRTIGDETAQEKDGDGCTLQ